jgi:hypothetical protein
VSFFSNFRVRFEEDISIEKKKAQYVQKKKAQYVDMNVGLKQSGTPKYT